MIGRPDELRKRLFARTLAVRTAVPLPDPERAFSGLLAVEGWQQDGPAAYVLTVSDPAAAAPAVTRALLAAGRLPQADRHRCRGPPEMKLSSRRVGAIVRRELREYRRRGSVVYAMAIVPVLFAVPGLIHILGKPASAFSGVRDLLLYMLGVPALVPAVLAAYSVVGERQQGTLESVLAALVPSLGVSYAVYALVLAVIELFAQPGVAAVLVRAPEILAQVLFTPLLAGWSIWVGVGTSTRSSDPRTAQQLSAFGSFPSIVVVVLIAIGVIPASLGLALGCAALLLLLDGFGWRIASAAFDRERLITGARS